MNLRNLEMIQEQERGSSRLPLGTLLLAAAAGGALVVVLMTTLERDAPPSASHVDPLEQLVERARGTPASPAAVVQDQHVTFPAMLSDVGNPTTAMAAVKDERGRLLPQEHAVDVAPTDQLPHLAQSEHLPKALLPAGELLSGTTVTQEPADELGQMAKSASELEPTELAPSGSEGGYEIQVASFREIQDSDTFVEELRKRGHRAYRQAAYVPERGLWHRVRIGPFKLKYEAMNYKVKFEEQERISTFLVDPAKVKQQREARDAKQAARDRKDAAQAKRVAAQAEAD
ncbi:MAG: hypothetical protein RJA70_2090 [Pseudomonadota bacterium]|jgi:cell division septation protein DedD